VFTGCCDGHAIDGIVGLHTADLRLPAASSQLQGVQNIAKRTNLIAHDMTDDVLCWAFQMSQEFEILSFAEFLCADSCQLHTIMP
jgi:hypothetical protein